MFLSLLSRLSLILYCSPLQALPTNFQGQYYCAPSVIKYAGFKSSLFNRRLAKRTKLNNSTSIGGKHQIVGIMSFVSSSKPLLFKETSVKKKCWSKLYAMNLHAQHKKNSSKIHTCVADVTCKIITKHVKVRLSSLYG